MAYIVERGRTLMTEFKCGRCGVTELLQFDDAPGGHAFSTVVRAQPVPPNWRDETGDLPLLCPKCKDAFRRFMNNQEVVK